MKSIKFALPVVLLFGMNACGTASEPTPEPIVAPEISEPPAPAEEITHIKPISIVKIQSALSRHGEKVTVDGRMGPATKNAIKAFQQKNDLPPTGIADKNTLVKLGLK